MKQRNRTTPEQKQPASIIAAGAAVFFSSACIMILELAASRLTARGLGSSIYTWTAVIGVALAGVTVGNYVGGRIADRLAGHRTIAGLFGIASIACVGAIVLSNRVGAWSTLWQLSWSTYVLIYVGVIFFPASMFLAAINPVAAKSALDRRLGTGRTIGTIYAFGAAGSIAGTFLAGFYLISAVGTTGVIWATAAVLAIAGLIYSPRFRLLNVWVVVLVALMAVGTAPGKWAEQTGTLLTIRTEPEPNLLYQDETQYCHVRIKQQSTHPDKRLFFQDKLNHSEIIMEDITNLQYPYARVYAAVTEQTSRNKNALAVLAIGGGGFVFPRYIKHKWPASRVDVAEIDPGVTKAATAAFGLSADSGINIFTMDGRNYIDGLIAGKRTGQAVQQYDYVYGDAYDNFSVPYQLVTKEFNDKVAEILKDDGFYMLNLIDVYQCGLLVGSVMNTLEQTFRNVYVVSPGFEYYNRTTFVLIGSRRTLDSDSLKAELTRYYREAWCLGASEVETLKKRCGGIVLTDDFSPVDNLAAPISRLSGPALMATVYIGTAYAMSQSGQRPVEHYMKAISIFPQLTIKTYYDIGEDLLTHGEFEEAAFVCRKALQYYDRPEIRNDISALRYNMGIALKGLGRTSESQKHLNRAIEGFKLVLQKDPNAVDILSSLGMALAETGDLAQASGYFERAVKAYPANAEYRVMLAEALIAQKRYAEATKAITEAIEYMRQTGQQEAVRRLQTMLGQVTYSQSSGGR